MAAERLSLRDKKVQANLAKVVGEIIEVHGLLAGGDPINKLEGDALAKDIVFQKEKQHRVYLQKDPYIKFTISDVTGHWVRKDASEQLVGQNIYKNPENGKTTLTVETKSRLTIGYRDGDKIVPIKHDSLAGKRLAYGQGVTITYEVYQMKDTNVCGLGVANIILDEKPKFYAGGGSDMIGAVKSQNWATEAVDVDSNDTDNGNDTDWTPAFD